MASNRVRRIHKEVADISKDPESNISVEVLNESDISHIKGSFPGPPDTPYEGGRYVIDIKIPNDYPFRPPHMKFETKVWHPNVSSVTGAICLDTLSTAWSPVLTIKSALISLQSLLSTPEPKDPQDAEVAAMLLKHPEQFKHQAREWAIQYAGATRKETGEGSGGETPATLKAKAQAQKQQSNQNKAAQYVYPSPYRIRRTSLTCEQVPRLQQRSRRSFLRHGLRGP